MKIRHEERDDSDSPADLDSPSDPSDMDNSSDTNEVEKISKIMNLLKGLGYTLDNAIEILESEHKKKQLLEELGLSAK